MKRLTVTFALLTVLAASAGASASEPLPTPARRDMVKDLDLAPPASERDIRVQVTATTSTTIGAGMAGRLSQFPLKDGDRFREGQLLARFDCAVQEGALARARASYEKRRKIYDIQDKQRQLGSNSAMDFEVAAAEMREAAADTAAAQAVASRCVIHAPFAGRVAAISAREHQYVGEGAPLIDILSDRDLELEMMVPSRWLSWLKVGARFDVAIDETGQTHAATVIRLSGKVDAVSQSIKVYGRIPSGADTLLPGMTGRAQFHPPQ